MDSDEPEKTEEESLIAEGNKVTAESEVAKSGDDGKTNGAIKRRILSLLEKTEEESLIAEGNKVTAESEVAKNGDDGKTDGAIKRRRILSLLEEILLTPCLYIGSLEPITKVVWVYEENSEMILKEITYVPGLYKIFDEILVNAAENKVRDTSMDTIRVDMDPVKNIIKIFYNGKGIPVVEHKEEKMFVPSLIFCYLLTSFNCYDAEEKFAGGHKCYGAKLCNIFSTSFELETGSKEECKKFKQTWTANMTTAGTPEVVPYFGEDFTEITFSPDLAKFNMNSLDIDTLALLSRRVVDIAASTRGVKVHLNGNLLPINNFKDYVDLCLKGEKDCLGNQLKCVYESVSDSWDIAVAATDKGFKQVSFANKFATTSGGRHLNYVIDIVMSCFLKHFRKVNKKNKTGVKVNYDMVKHHLMVFVNCSVINPIYDSETKDKLTSANLEFIKCRPSENFFTKLINDSGVVERVMLFANTYVSEGCASS